MDPPPGVKRVSMTSNGGKKKLLNSKKSLISVANRSNSLTSSERRGSERTGSGRSRFEKPRGEGANDTDGASSLTSTPAFGRSASILKREGSSFFAIEFILLKGLEAGDDDEFFRCTLPGAAKDGFGSLCEKAANILEINGEWCSNEDAWFDNTKCVHASVIFCLIPLLSNLTLIDFVVLYFTFTLLYTLLYFALLYFSK
jgi:hypothetical protein